jgi:Integrase core domain
VLSWLVLPARSGALRANAIAERFIGTLRHECLDHLMITGPRHLAAVLQVRSRHYNVHRPRRSLRQHTPTVRPLRRDRLGALVYENVQVACRDRVLGTHTPRLPPESEHRSSLQVAEVSVGAGPGRSAVVRPARRAGPGRAADNGRVGHKHGPEIALDRPVTWPTTPHTTAPGNDEAEQRSNTVERPDEHPQPEAA